MLAPNTQTILLLCGRFGRPQESGVSPLEQREYNKLEMWLARRNMEPAELLNLGESDLQDPELPVPAARLLALLERGSALALAVESWESKGLWVMSRKDEHYPPRIKALGPPAPPVLYGAGDRRLLSGEGQALAIVGSRDVDEATLEYTRELARACAVDRIAIVSGGARGVDSQAMGAAMERGGTAIGVLADKLTRAAVAAEHREALVEGQLVLISPYDPDAGFTIGNAMGRNKYVYALTDAALVVHASPGSGGTWAGAEEALKKGRPPVFVLLMEPAPEGNVMLLTKGAHAFPDEAREDLAGWLEDSQQDRVVNRRDEANVRQGTLF